MKLIVFFLFISTLIACQNDKKTQLYFKSINFSYFDISPLSFTLKIYNQDSIFLEQKFSPEENLKSKTIYKGMLTRKLKQQLDSLMTVINFDKLDSVYETGHLDGDEYKLDIEDFTGKRHFRVHSLTPPTELEALKQLFLNIRMIFLPLDTTRNLKESLFKVIVQGNPKTFVLKVINNDKYYLADSINKIFHEGFIGQTPLIAIGGIIFKYQRKLDTIVLPFSKSDIVNIGFLNKKDSRFMYCNEADSGAVIINTISN